MGKVNDMELHMWTNEFDFVIAETAEEARQIAVSHMGCDEEEAGDFETMNSDGDFTFVTEDAGKLTQKISEWISQVGKGYFANSEY